MGTYDTRGGAPISPREPDYSPTEREEDVLGVLEALDVARDNARAVLGPVFVDLVKARYPIGSVIELNTVNVLHGHAYGATRARVRTIFDPDVSLSNPEGTRVSVECVCLKKDGSASGNVVRFNEPVLGKKYELGVVFEDKPLAPRDHLVNLVHTLDATAEEGPSP